ncbi:MAG: prepilin-type N-terminal cleavage/methylation domain-containing protein [Desulfomonile tiedjei]|nr:prepilin-type N-terminal cleavage/methylation domain-containing protein [Desulfomonile tiedjei]
MNKRNGFTILELLVTMAVFAIVAAAAIALFQFQTKASAGSNKRKFAGEAVTLALMTIQRDIERAGMGLMKQQPLALMVNDGGTDRPDELYLSYSEHVNMGLARDKTYSFFDLGSAAGQGKLWFTMAGGTSLALADVGAWVGTDGASPPIGGVIRRQGTNKPDTITLKSFKPETQSGTQKSKNQRTVTLEFPAGVGGNVAPAVSYRLIASAADRDAFPIGSKPQLGTLMRNGLPNSGAGLPLIGGWEGQQPSPVKVTDFQVRCGFARGVTCNFAQYYQDKSTACWAPDSGNALGDLGWEIGNLRVIEVTIKYIVIDRGGGADYPNPAGYPGPDPRRGTGMTIKGFGLVGDSTYGPWAMGGSQTITVAPRNIVLGQYLGPPN